MSITTFLLGMLFFVVSALAYITSMLAGWELSIIMVMAFPILAYARRNPKVHNIYLLMTILYSGGRFIMNHIAVNCTDLKSVLKPPLNINNTIVLQLAGFSCVIAVILYFAIIFITTIITVKDEIHSCNTIEEISKNSKVIRLNNLFSCNMFINIVVMFLFIPLYSLQDYWLHIVIFVIILISVSVSYYMLEIDSIRRRKEEILMLEKECEDKKRSNYKLFNLSSRMENDVPLSEEDKELKELEELVNIADELSNKD